MDKSHIITIAALGPDSGELLTLGALTQMRGADALVLRTARHGAADVLTREGIAYDTLDPLYEDCEDFDELCARAAQALISRARGVRALCYAVGDPVSDATVRALARALPEDVGLRVLGGVTLADGAACAAIPFGVDTENLRVVTALSTQGLRVQADCPQVITELDNRYLASDVKLWLGDLFDDEMTVYFLENAAEPGAQARPIPLCELDRQPRYDHRTAVLVPRVSVYERRRATYEDFLEVVARLRAPGGCPWDRAQTHHTLRQYMIEEACEAAEAMDGDDPMKIADELGDVLLQVVLNSCIGAEHRAFTDRDVTSLAARKMITRHEHVFGRATAKDAQAVVSVWERAKKKERGEQSALERMEEVPASLPALMRAQKVIRRQAQSAGAEPDAAAARARAAQVVQAILQPGAGEAQLGEALEALCALAQAMGLDAEIALRSATARRIERQRAGEKG
ncbi:MAG: MazG family protein [Candidatus Ventricola sp.]